MCVLERGIRVARTIFHKRGGGGWRQKKRVCFVLSYIAYLNIFFYSARSTTDVRTDTKNDEPDDVALDNTTCIKGEGGSEGGRLK